MDGVRFVVEGHGEEDVVVGVEGFEGGVDEGFVEVEDEGFFVLGVEGLFGEELERGRRREGHR